MPNWYQFTSTQRDLVFFYSTHWTVVSVCSPPLNMNVRHKLGDFLTFPSSIYILLWIQTYPPRMIRKHAHAKLHGTVFFHCDASKWAAADQYQASMSASRRGGVIKPILGMGGLSSNWPRGPYPTPVILLSGGSEELSIGDSDSTKRQVHLQDLWRHWNLGTTVT